MPCKHYSQSLLIYPFHEYMVSFPYSILFLKCDSLSLARIIDLQICAWLKQDPLDSEQISTWIETHHDVLQFDRKIEEI